MQNSQHHTYRTFPKNSDVFFPHPVTTAITGTPPTAPRGLFPTFSERVDGLNQDATPLLPLCCPIVTKRLTSGIVRACCFRPRFFKELVDEGGISLERGCPLIQVCGLFSLWPRLERSSNDDSCST